MKLLRIILLYVSFIIMLSATITGMQISRYSGQFSDTPADAAIVLGAAIHVNEPSPVFRERINHAINLYKKDKVKFLIFTGGIGAGHVLSEAEVAKTYAQKQGVPTKHILLETRSTVTFENLTEAQSILRANGLDTVLLVSDPLHMKRAMKMADDLSINASPSPTPTSMYKSWDVKMKFLIREVFFYFAYLLVG